MKKRSLKIMSVVLAGVMNDFRRMFCRRRQGKRRKRKKRGKN